MQPSFSVIVAGAGVAGCLIARRLANLPGCRVLVLEEVDQHHHLGAGAGLNLGPNAAKALRLYDPVLLQELRSVSEPWQSWSISHVDGTLWKKWSFRDLAEDDGIRIRWASLYDVLRSSIRDYTCHCVSVTGARQLPDGRMAVQSSCPDGSIREDIGDFLIAADGRYSQLRKSLVGDTPVNHYGVAIGRLMSRAEMTQNITDYAQWFFGPNRLLAYRVSPDMIYIAATLPLPPGGALPDRLARPEFLRTLYTPPSTAACQAVAWIVNELMTRVGDIHWARFQESTPCFREHSGRALFLGDSSHAMLPTLGQGATQAIEGACVAGYALEVSWDAIQKSHSAGLDQWLTEFEAVRADRVRFAMDLSVRAADTIRGLVDSRLGTLAKDTTAFQSELRQLYTNVPQSSELLKRFNRN